MLVAAIVLAAAGAAAPRSWRDGPVRYLLTDGERRAFGQLTDDAARAAYVESFWKSLDPDPATATNEFRTTFEARCAAANARFESIGGDGWSSDRGRVYILLGEPSGIRRETGGLVAVEREVWTYDAGDGSQVARIEFFRCPDGEHRLDRSCPAGTLTSAAADWDRENALRWARATDPAVSRMRLRYLISSFLTPPATQAAPTRSPAPAVPAPVAAGAPVVVSARLSDRSYFFRAQDGSVLAFLTLELAPAPGEPDASPDDVLAAVTLEGRTILLERVETGGGAAVFFGRLYLPGGGGVDARFTLKDGRREEILVREGRLSPPELSGFSASSVVPAERFGPADSDASGRFVVGSEEIVPRQGATFHRGELLRLYLQVYGAAVDPSTSMPRVDVAFRFTCDAKRRPKSMRAPFRISGATGASMGLALPIGDWPAGAYRVDVELRDRISGARTTAAGAFRVAADEIEDPAR